VSDSRNHARVARAAYTNATFEAHTDLGADEANGSGWLSAVAPEARAGAKDPGGSLRLSASAVLGP
jgi:hypothetical protein